jgi:hypothetical protein
MDGDLSMRPAIGFSMHWLLEGEDDAVVSARLMSDRRYRHFTASEREEILALANQNVTATYKLQQGTKRLSVRSVCKGADQLGETIGLRYSARFEMPDGSRRVRQFTVNAATQMTRGAIESALSDSIGQLQLGGRGNDSTQGRLVGLTLESVVCQGLDQPSFAYELPY